MFGTGCCWRPISSVDIALVVAKINLKVLFYSLDNYTAVFCCEGALALVLKGEAP